MSYDAYFYSFEPTGNDAVDMILQAVAAAGKGCHHTEDWSEYGLDKGIQDAANNAAALLSARATPQAPTPAAAEGQAEATCDQCIELAEELQKEWMRKVIAGTRTAASLLNPGKFRGGMETACDEIETRMARNAAPLPRQAAVQGKQAEPTSIDIAKRMYGKWTDEQGIHCNRFPAFSELSTADQQKWIAKARAGRPTNSGAA